MTAAEIKAELPELAASGEQVFASDHRRLATGARRHFGSCKNALAAAGCPDAHLMWTSERVIETIRHRQKRGQPVNPMAILRADPSLYAAGRRRFGNWDAALQAALEDKAPVVRISQLGRPRKRQSRR
jgi:hypothetical protein